MRAFLRERRLGDVLFGLVLIGIGCFACYRGVVTPPGQPAVSLSKYEDWSVTDALIVGPLMCALGVYVVVKHAARPR